MIISANEDIIKIEELSSHRYKSIYESKNIIMYLISIFFSFIFVLKSIKEKGKNENYLK